MLGFTSLIRLLALLELSEFVFGWYKYACDNFLHLAPTSTLHIPYLLFLLDYNAKNIDSPRKIAGARREVIRVIRAIRL